MLPQGSKTKQLDFVCPSWIGMAAVRLGVWAGDGKIIGCWVYGVSKWLFDRVTEDEGGFTKSAKHFIWDLIDLFCDKKQKQKQKTKSTAISFWV